MIPKILKEILFSNNMDYIIDNNKFQITDNGDIITLSNSKVLEVLINVTKLKKRGIGDYYISLDNNKKIFLKDTIDGYKIIQSFDGHLSKGKVYNQYWLVVDNNDSQFYIMDTSQDVFFMFSVEHLNVVLNSEDESIPTWYYNFQSHRIQAETKNGQLILHNQILPSDHCVVHINGNRCDNRIDNLKLDTKSAVMSGVNEKKARERKSTARSLPEELGDIKLPTHVEYSRDILNKETGEYRDYFRVVKDPVFIEKLGKSLWTTTKSMKKTITEKYQELMETRKQVYQSDSSSTISSKNILKELIANPPNGIYLKTDKGRGDRYCISKTFLQQERDFQTTSKKGVSNNVKFCLVLNEYEKRKFGSFDWEAITSNLTSEEKTKLSLYIANGQTQKVPEELQADDLPLYGYFTKGKNEEYFYIKSTEYQVIWSSSRTKNVDIYTKLEQFVDKYCEIYPDMSDEDKSKINGLKKLLE
jgi:hypothetical protein